MEKIIKLLDEQNRTILAFPLTHNYMFHELCVTFMRYVNPSLTQRWNVSSNPDGTFLHMSFNEYLQITEGLSNDTTSDIKKEMVQYD